MEPQDQELSDLRRQVEDLQRRMEKLEAASPVTSAPPPSMATPVPPPLQTVPPPAPRSAPPVASPVLPRVSVPRKPIDTQTLESRIGTHWLNRVGIVAVLVGVSLFLKYAFDNGWIGPAGRIGIGLLAGIAVVFWSETFRRKGYALFSYGLKAVGIGTLYLSLWAAVQVYHLIPPGVGFGAMLLVTAATVVMALTQNAQLLAAYALAGGFSTPALVSTGQNHEVFLFSYTALLAAGSVVLTALRGWRRLSVGAFFGTLVMYLAWYEKYYRNDEFGITVFFASLFFLIFATAAIIPRTGESSDSTPLASILGVANAVVFFFQIYALVDSVYTSQSRDDIMAFLAIALAAFYVVIAKRIAQQSEGTENRRAVNLIHLALAVGFLTTAVPLKLSGHWITIGWLVESAALLYVSERIKHTFLRIFASVALVLGIGKLLVDYWPHQSMLLVNGRFASYLVALAVLGFVLYGLRDSKDRRPIIICSVLFNLLALIALYAEVQDFFQPAITASWSSGDYSSSRSTLTLRGFSHSAVWMLYGGALMFFGFRRRSAMLRWQAIVLLGITVIKVFLVDTSQLETGFRILSFIGLGAILLAVSFLYQRGHLTLPGKDSPSQT